MYLILLDTFFELLRILKPLSDGANSKASKPGKSSLFFVIGRGDTLPFSSLFIFQTNCKCNTYNRVAKKVFFRKRFFSLTILIEQCIIYNPFL